MKKCKRCGIEKPLAEFSPNGIYSYQPKCKVCRNEMAHKQYLLDKKFGKTKKPKRVPRPTMTLRERMELGL